ncbi:MAG: hypothetical protein E7607_07855 [Ruminococcaceae bacterium]|nr:hypothetical protein [Oscillospiraceae bacterium]
MKKLLAILLAAMMLISGLVACKDKNTTDGNSGETSADDSSSSTTDSSVLIFKKGEPSKYRIIYHESLPSLLKSKVQGVDYTAEQKFKLDIETSILFPNFENSDVSEFEILFGDTKREESISAKEELLGKAKNEYAIKLFENGKIAVVASNDSSLEKAIDYFLSSFISNNTTDELRLEKDFVYYVDLGSVSKYSWSLSGIPEYKGGTLNTRVYNKGTNRTMISSGGRVQVVSETNITEFNQYLAELDAAGYEKIASHAIANNVYAQYYNGKNLVYAYFTATESEARIILDSASIPLKEFNYTYTAKEGDTSAFYQYAMMYNPGGQGGQDSTTRLWENASLFDIIKLADNSVILLDGGWEPMATDKAVEECLKFLREITGTPEGEKVRVAAIYLTHFHEDHLAFTQKLVEQHSEEIEVERLMHNLLAGSSNGAFARFGKSLMEKFPTLKFIQLHTGQKIQLADATFEVLFTHEDLYTRTDLPLKSINTFDQNNSSTMLKMTMNGRTFLLTGDWSGGHEDRDKYEYKGMEASLLNAMKLSDGTSYLKCDVLQIPHHAINDWIDNFIKAVDPDIAFIPQQDASFDQLAHDCFKNNVKALNSIGVTNENIFFSGRYTYGITVALDGTMTLSYRGIAGYDDAYKTLVLDKYEPFHEPQSGVVPFK